MFLRKWKDLPDFMKTPEVQEYYTVLQKRKVQIAAKRGFDIVVSLILILVLSLPMVILALAIKMDSSGGIFYRQRRVTTYGKEFMIHKFRTMVDNADRLGGLITAGNDSRITRVGAVIRNYRLDEIPQLFDVLRGNMSFVGTRPEVPRYVKMYTNEMNATLLLPAGITSEASIRFRNEAQLIEESNNVDAVYMEVVLPQKMKYNLEAIRNFSFWADIMTMFRTVFAVLGKNYDKEEEMERV